MLRTLKILTWFCACCLAIAFVAITAAPQAVERSARPYIIRMVGDEALSRYPALQRLGKLHELAVIIRSKAARTRDLATSNYPEALAEILAPLCEYQCAETALASTVRNSLMVSLAKWDIALDRVEQWTRGRYGELVGNVLTDLRVFLGTNSVLLFLAGASLHFGFGARRIQVLISAILLATVLLGAYFYLFAQNWLLTVLLSSYVGAGYIAWVCLMAATLSDCVFNRARATQALMGALVSPFNG